ncbi:MAG: transcriptional regulator, HxlR family [Promethearchaeota archaeon CR_4]|nr:MAG: transcriptional regulator, HxlR family [Candidatus Lokiarchaeota archaeon CR_4]
MYDETLCNHSDESPCAVRGVLEIVSKKWVICITNLLERGKSLRYSEIKSFLSDISPKTLSDTLKVLERERLITRTVYPETPPRVEYLLTQDGEELKQALEPLVNWTRKREKFQLEEAGRKTKNFLIQKSDVE